MIKVEDLAQAILHQENLHVDALDRCRCEVLLQLAFAPPWRDIEEPPLTAEMPDDILLEFLSPGCAAPG